MVNEPNKIDIDRNKIEINTVVNHPKTPFKDQFFLPYTERPPPPLPSPLYAFVNDM
jgi:hypothetical protein